MRHRLASALRSVGPLEWLALPLGIWLVLRYAWFMDDAFVFFRYADNLLFLGHGLVWNAGEYVEGFSSPLWMLILCAARTSGLDWWVITRLLGVASATGFWALLVAFDRRMTPRGAPRIGIPLVYTFLAYGPLCYFTSGLETPLVQVAAVVYALHALNPASLPLQLFIGVTPLLRHELALTWLAALVWSWARTRRFPRALLASAIVVPGGWLVFRVWYYADLLPNTFYLKDTVDLVQGWIYVLDTATTYALAPFLLVHAALLVWLWRRSARSADERDALQLGPRLWMVALALLITAYVVKIGGDPRHYRYLAFPFVLVACACGGLAEHALLALDVRLRRPVALTAGALLAAFVVTRYPRQLDAHPYWGTEHHTMVRKINDASPHRNLEILAQPRWGPGVNVEFRPQYAAYRREHRDPPYRSVAVHSFCVKMFRHFDTRWVQSLGLTEAVLARTHMAADRPAHKLGLVPMAEDIRAIVERAGNRPAPGMYRAAVENGTAPAWVRDNLESIEVIEQKQFNRHRWLENLRLAFTFPARIEPGPSAARPVRQEPTLDGG